MEKKHYKNVCDACGSVAGFTGGEAWEEAFLNPQMTEFAFTQGWSKLARLSP